MASGSSQAAHSTSAPLRKHDVFLSFYGKDTRKGFSDHLYTALKEKGIFVFRDNEELEKGENISKLLKAIQESKYAVIVISKNYAFSKWCLRELTEIVECKRDYRLTILPIFYYVDPSNVRKQQGSFADGLATHEEESKEEGEKWRSALNEVGDIAGWHVHDSYESKILQEVCGEILIGLSHHLSINFKDIVGIKSQVKQILTLLHARDTTNDVYFVGIYGMGGIGKTTLAQVIFNNISSKFKVTCFVDDVRERFQKFGIVHLQEDIISKTLGDRDIKIRSCLDGIRVISNRLRDKKIFLVLDDVDKDSLIEALAESPDWFGQGSRVLLTSRNKQLLERFMEEIYEVKGLSDNDDLQLFCLKAFKKGHPIEEYENLSKEFVSYAHGLPLALQVFGSYLFKKELHVWESTLKRWKEESPNEISDKLKISFDDLSYSQKELFLDIACFFNKERVNNVIQYLDSIGYYPNSNIEVLQDRCLIKVFRGIFEMHDLLQEMGQQIVRKESLEDRGNRSRLWCSEDIVHVLKNNIGTDAVKGIFLRLPLPKPIKLSFEGFSKMQRLKMLVIRVKCVYDISIDEAFEHLRTVKWCGNPSEFMLSNELRILEWWGYPFEYLPTNFEHDNLIELKIPMSSIKHLWNAEKKLKHIDLRDSQNLVKIPDFGRVSNVEELDVKGVQKRQLSSSIVLPKKLYDCPLYMKSLGVLNLSYCNLTDGALLDDLDCLSSLWYLDLSGNKFTKIDCVSKLSSLSKLVLKNCDKLKALPPRLSSPLYQIGLEKCSSLTTFSEVRDILTLSETLVAGDITLRGFYFGHEGKHYCTTHLAQSAIREYGGCHFAAVAWGPTLTSDVPEWFASLPDIFGMFQRCFEVEKGNYSLEEDVYRQSDFDDYWGYALFIVYEVVGLDENGNFSPTTTPVFGCELEVQKVNDRKVPMDYVSEKYWNGPSRRIFVEEWRSRERVPREYCSTSAKHRIAFRVPDIPSVGRHGVWVFIGGDCFREAGLEECEDLGLCSISISSLNVEMKECGGRLVLNHDLSKCRDIIKSISPRDLDSAIAQSAFRRGILNIDNPPREREKEWEDGKNCPSLTSYFDPRYILTSFETLMDRNTLVEAFYFGYKSKHYRTYHLAQSLINKWNPALGTSDFLLGRYFAPVAWGPTLTSDIPKWFTTLLDISGIFQRQFEAERRPDLPEFAEASLFSVVVGNPHLYDPYGIYDNLSIVSCWGYALFIVYEVLELNSYQKKEEIHEVDEYGNFGSTIFSMFVCELEVQEEYEPKVTNERVWRNVKEWTTFKYVPGKYRRTLGKVPIVFRVPDIPSVGRNGVWVFINGKCFEKVGLDRCGNVGLCSISISSPNVDVKECGGRLVLKHDHSECYEIIKSISPRGLGSDTFKDIFYGGGFTVFGDIIPGEKRKEGNDRKGVEIYEEGEEEGVDIIEDWEEEEGGKKGKRKKNCPSLTLLTSSEMLMGRDICEFEAFYFGYDDKPYRTYHLAQSFINHLPEKLLGPCGFSIGPPQRRHFATVTWGPTLTSDIPEWFTSLPDTSRVFQRRFEAEAQSGFLSLPCEPASLYYEKDSIDIAPMVSSWGYALFIVYEIFESDSCQRKGEIHEIEVDAYGNSSSAIFPEFVCELELFTKGRTQGKVPIVFRVLDIPSVGRNGVWVFINGSCFRKAGLECCDNAGLESCDDAGLYSISISSPNVDVKECGDRLVLKNDSSECYEIIKSISPHGLDSETLQDAFYEGGFRVFGDMMPGEKRK